MSRMSSTRHLVAFVSTSVFAAFAFGCSANVDAPPQETIGSTSQAILSACDESHIRADAPPSASTWFDRAFTWVHEGVMYCECTGMAGAGAYRSDCSGFVSYIWGLPAPGHTTYSFAGGPWDDHKSTRITWGELTPGDALNFPGDPSAGVGHVMLFAGWLDAAHTKVCAVEESHTGTPAHVSTHNLSDPGSWWGGSGTFGSIFLPMRLSGYTPTPPDVAPTGSLDTVDCTSIGGWAQDPDAPTTAIATHVYFNGPAGDASAHGIALTSDQNRSDLCKAIGSCDHAFSMTPPRSLLDGKAHQVFAYGIDLAPGTTNTLLPNSPKSMTCTAPAIPKGTVKRHVISPAILGDWKFDTFLDVAPYAKNVIDAIEDGKAIDVAPALVSVKGDPAIYVSDHGFKRHVVDPASMTAWRFATTDVKTIDAPTMAKLVAGPDWPKSPELAQGTGDASIYMLDEPLPEPQVSYIGDPSSKDPGGSTGSTSVGGDGSRSSDDVKGGCAMGSGTRNTFGGAWALIAFALFAARNRARMRRCVDAQRSSV
jgi:hypothetical protein